ncbi:hypothetical protein BDZ89DRAFT_458647 [Hymenopellis radicata]|nr:hypothetical protein BDZ89DRAFT_458647 [Hymenopellis radicata]
MPQLSLRRSASPHGTERWMPCQMTRDDCSCPNHLTIPAANIPPNFSTSSSLHHLTRTNERPTTVEEISIRDTISKLEAHQRALTTYSANLEALHVEAYKQIACIEMEMKRVLDAQVAADRVVLEHKIALSPIRRVPPEVLLLIFEQAMEFPIRTYHHRCRESICSETNILWTLELVCRSWKNMVSTSSHLWSFVVVNLVHCEYPYYMRRLAKQVSRLGRTTGPISVSISSERTRDAVPIQIAAILLPLIPRVEELYLHMSPSSLDSLKLWTHSLSSLTRLVISRHRYRHGEVILIGPIGRCDAFRSAPNLVFLEMMDAFGPEEPYTLPWGQLVQYTSVNTHVDCTRSDCWACPQPHKFLRMLAEQLTPKLQKCSFLLRNASKPSDFLGFDLPVVSDMRSLTLSAPPVAVAHSAIEQFADSIHFLTELAVDLSVAGKPRSNNTFRVLHSIAGMLERAQPPLTSFTLRQCQIPPLVLAQLLRAVPFLQELRLEDVEGVEKILVPQLRTFMSSGVMRFDKKVLTDMFQSRTATTPLQSVELCWHVEEAGVMEKRELKMKI